MDKSILYKACELCERRCKVDRTEGEIGYCRSLSVPKITRAALHFWEEPIISGDRGSGTVFFSGCSLGCIYCQNRAISRSSVGRDVTDTELADTMLDLERQGAHNINFVTPAHFAPSVITATRLARERGLSVPIVYNTGSYDTVDTICSLGGTVDIYLPDLKYYRASTARELSFAENYPSVAWDAISEMVRQHPEPIVEQGIMRSGVIVRILLLPAHVAEAKLSLKRLYDTYGDSIYVSLMNQYTPMPGMSSPLDRKVTKSEYAELVDYAERLGIKNAFIQEDGTQSESFIPEFYTE